MAELTEISESQFNALGFHNNKVLQACTTNKAKRRFDRSFTKLGGPVNFIFFLLRSPSDLDQFISGTDHIIGMSISQPFAIFKVVSRYPVLICNGRNGIWKSAG